ncbi:MAG: hypothetical protein IJK72_01435 [Mycoplasma sp.]|nr:hypothetical protein [Mycoplasma sp.]
MFSANKNKIASDNKNFSDNVDSNNLFNSKNKIVSKDKNIDNSINKTIYPNTEIELAKEITAVNSRISDIKRIILACPKCNKDKRIDNYVKKECQKIEDEIKRLSKETMHDLSSGRFIVIDNSTLIKKLKNDRNDVFQLTTLYSTGFVCEEHKPLLKELEDKQVYLEILICMLNKRR